MTRWILTGLTLAAAAAAARADVYTVGPGGTHSTIQSAIDTAVASGGLDEIHVATGRWRERIRLVFGEGQSVRLSGGWVDGFSRQVAPDPGDPGNPSLNSVLDGEGVGPVVSIQADGFVSVQGFTITGGNGGSVTGGGLRIHAAGFGAVEVHGNVIWENQLSMPDGATGGGLMARAVDSAHLSLRQNHFLRNSVTAAGDGVADSGGADVFARDNAFVEVNENRFVGNVVRADGEATYAALAVEIQGDARGHVDDNVARDNRAVSKSGLAYSAFRLGAAALGLPGRPRLVARRNEIVGNVIESPRGQQVELHATVGGTLELTDSVVAGGSGGGIIANARDEGAMYLVNLTVADHPAYGLAAGSGVHVTNTILFGNGVDLQGDPIQSHNLIGVDPLFVAAGNYHLSLGSPAVDAGLNSATGLGPSDIDREARIQGRRVDIGADETTDHGVPEPLCTVLLPEIVIPHSFPICRCVSDPGLRMARCGALTPDLFLVFRVPLRWQDGEEIPATWTIHPWTPVAGPYAMSAEARIDGKWVPQEWLGPTAKTLGEGKLLVEPFSLELPAAGRTTVRTTVKYLRPGQKGFSTVAVEVALPDPSERPSPK
jgi:hypothetical protein